MIRYIIQRVLLLIPTMIGITLISFLIMHLAPGDPVELFLGGLAGSEGIATDEPSDLEKTREDLRRQLGLDKPIHVQYLSWLSNLLLRVERLSGYERTALLVDRVLDDLEPDTRDALGALDDEARKSQFRAHFEKRFPGRVDELVGSSFWEGRTVKLESNYRYEGPGLELGTLLGRRFVTLNFGRSFKDQRPVIRRIGDRLPITVEISAISLIVAYLVGLPVGVWAAVKQNTLTDRVLTAGTFMLWSMPSFWVGNASDHLLLQQGIFLLVPRVGHSIDRGGPRLGGLASAEGPRPSHGPAGPGVCLRELRGDIALHAHEHAGKFPAGLRSHRTRQGTVRARRRFSARDAQFADSDRDDSRLSAPGIDRGVGLHRDDFHDTRSRISGLPVRAGEGLSGRDGNVYDRIYADADWDSCCGRASEGGGSTH